MEFIERPIRVNTEVVLFDSLSAQEFRLPSVAETSVDFSQDFSHQQSASPSVDFFNVNAINDANDRSIHRTLIVIYSFTGATSPYQDDALADAGPDSIHGHERITLRDQPFMIQRLNNLYLASHEAFVFACGDESPDHFSNQHYKYPFYVSKLRHYLS